MNVLIVGNGAGKSNFIALFRFINRIIEGKLQVYTAQSGGVVALFRFGPKHTDKISIKLDFSGANYWFILVPTQENLLLMDEESCL